MGAAEESAAGAVAAVGGAGEVDLGEDAVGETLLDAGCDGGGAVFAEGVGAEAVGEELAGVGEELAGDGVGGVGEVGEGDVVGGDEAGPGGEFVAAEVARGEAVAELPAPVGAAGVGGEVSG